MASHPVNAIIINHLIWPWKSKVPAQLIAPYSDALSMVTNLCYYWWSIKIYIYSILVYQVFIWANPCWSHNFRQMMFVIGFLPKFSHQRHWLFIMISHEKSPCWVSHPRHRVAAVSPCFATPRACELRWEDDVSSGVWISLNWENHGIPWKTWKMSLEDPLRTFWWETMGNENTWWQCLDEKERLPHSQRE